MKRPKFELVPSSKDGQELIREALARQQQQHNNQVLKIVQDTIERLSLMRAIKSKTERRIDLLEKQLTAINKAEFTIASRQYSSEVTIRFNDHDLNVSWDETEKW